MADYIIAKQFTPIYDEKEDRLKLIININYPDRYDIWITRKFLIDIIDNLQTYIRKFKDNNTQQNSNKNNTIDSSESIIYTPINNATLLETLNITKKEDSFILTLKDNTQTIQAILSLNDLENLLNALIQPVKLRWGLGL